MKQLSNTFDQHQELSESFSSLYFLKEVLKLFFHSLFDNHNLKAGKILKKTKIGLIDFSDFSSVDGTGDREMFNQMYLDL